MPEAVQLFHIWAKGDQQAAKSKSEEAMAKLKAGTPFFDVAYSISMTITVSWGAIMDGYTGANCRRSLKP